MARWDRARELYEHLSQTRDQSERVEHLLSLASVLERGGGERAAVVKSYEAVFDIAQGDPERVAALEARFRESGDWQTFVELGERVIKRARVVAAPQSVLRLAIARAYEEELRRKDAAEEHLKAAIEAAPEDANPCARLGRLQLDAGRSRLAIDTLRRALEIDPLNTPALRSLGGALLREGMPDLGRMLGEAAGWLEGAPAPQQPMGPLMVRKPLSPSEIQSLFPRSGTRTLTEIARLVEPHAAGLIAEVTGQVARGEPILDVDPVARLCGDLASALGLSPMRLFVDGVEARLVGDEALALAVGTELLSPFAQGRLTFSVAHIFAWIAHGSSLGAYLKASELAPFIDAAAREQESDELKELRRRIAKPLPRRVRREVERLVATEVRNLSAECATWYADGKRAADRIAILLSRDVRGALEITGRSRENARKSPRAVDLLKYLASDACWRAHQRLGSLS
jgi:tetratricopeptide (TPR) repeat protein